MSQTQAFPRGALLAGPRDDLKVLALLSAPMTLPVLERRLAQIGRCVSRCTSLLDTSSSSRPYSRFNRHKTSYRHLLPHRQDRIQPLGKTSQHRASLYQPFTVVHSESLAQLQGRKRSEILPVLVQANFLLHTALLFTQEKPQLELWRRKAPVNLEGQKFRTCAIHHHGDFMHCVVKSKAPLPMSSGHFSQCVEAFDIQEGHGLSWMQKLRLSPLQGMGYTQGPAQGQAAEQECLIRGVAQFDFSNGVWSEDFSVSGEEAGLEFETLLSQDGRVVETHGVRCHSRHESSCRITRPLSARVGMVFGMRLCRVLATSPPPA